MTSLFHTLSPPQTSLLIRNWILFNPSDEPKPIPLCIHEPRDSISGRRCLAGWDFWVAFPTGRIQANHCQSCSSSGRKENPSPSQSISSGSRTRVFFPGNRDWLSETPPELRFVLPRCLPQASYGGRRLLEGGVLVPRRMTQNFHYLTVIQHQSNFISRKRLRQLC